MRRIAVVGLLLFAGLVVVPASRAMDVDRKIKTERLIKKGRFDEAMALVEKTLAGDPQDAQAHALGARILRARGSAAGDEAALVQWADSKPAAGAPVEALLGHYRHLQRWDDVAALTARAAAVTAEAREPLLRELIDALAEGGRRGDLAAPVGLLLGTSDAPTLAYAVEAIDAAAKADVPRMLRAFVSIPDDSGNGAALDRLGLVVSRRAAAAVQGKVEAGAKGKVSLPPTGAYPPESVSTPPVERRKTEPVYPDIARRARIEGLVQVRTVVLASGRTLVTGTIEASNPLFVSYAVDAVASWRYEPATKDGRAVAVDYVVIVEFRLRAGV